MSHGYGDDNANNQWLTKTAKYILGEYKPKVFWGENAPGFAGKIYHHESLQGYFVIRIIWGLLFTNIIGCVWKFDFTLRISSSIGVYSRAKYVRARPEGRDLLRVQTKVPR
jgi:hypothetical protein